MPLSLVRVKVHHVFYVMYSLQWNANLIASINKIQIY